MSSRAFLNSFMLCPRLRAKSGSFFAPKRTRTMRRMINKSGPPRFPIPNARVFITMLNRSGPMLYSPEPVHIFYIMHRSLSTIWRQSRRTGEDPHRTRLSLLGVVAITIFNPPCNSWEGRCAPTLLSPVLRLLHSQTCKSSQVFRTDVGDRPECESIAFPMQNIIAVRGETFRGCGPARFQRPDKQVNNM